jgi:hypothetical protein
MKALRNAKLGQSLVVLVGAVNLFAAALLICIKACSTDRI